MDGRKVLRVSRETCRSTAIGLSFALAIMPALWGCGDHRVSLQQFMEMQQELRQAPAASQPSTSQPSTTQAAAEAAIDACLGPYEVGPSDVLAVSVTTTAQAAAGPIPPIMVRVSRQGEIELPYVGKIKVGGMVLEDVEKAIQTAYVPKVYKDLIAHVEVVLPETTNVLVVGAVTRPGLVQLRRTQRSLLHAIVGAEGASSVASGLVTLRRLRRPAEEVTLNLRDPEELRASLTLDPLEQGDIVTVQAAMPNTIFVGGLVMTAHPQPYPPGIAPTVLQAIAASGGLRTDVTPREATLIRRMPDGRDVHVKLNLDRITTGQDRNIELAAGDILWVPDTVETRVQDWINRNIFLRAGVSATWNISYNTTGLNWLNNNAKAESLANQGTTGTTSGSQASQFNALDFLGRNALLQNLAAP